MLECLYVVCWPDQGILVQAPGNLALSSPSTFYITLQWSNYLYNFNLEIKVKYSSGKIILNSQLDQLLGWVQYSIIP